MNKSIQWFLLAACTAVAGLPGGSAAQPQGNYVISAGAITSSGSFLLPGGCCAGLLVGHSRFGYDSSDVTFTRLDTSATVAITDRKAYRMITS